VAVLVVAKVVMVVVVVVEGVGAWSLSSYVITITHSPPPP